VVDVFNVVELWATRPSWTSRSEGLDLDAGLRVGEGMLETWDSQMLQSTPLTEAATAVTAAPARTDRRWRSFIVEARRVERVERMCVERE
jgi:hypothetical protein